MKSFKVKALAVAVLGMAGMGVASAACTNSTPFAAWSSWDAAHSNNTGQAFGGKTDAAPGLDGTSCSMSSYFTSFNTSLGEQAIVYDNSPAKEQTYRFRFYIDPTNVKAGLSSLNTVGIFTAKSASNHGATPTNQIVYMNLNSDGTNVFVRTAAACTTGDNFQGNKCRASSDVQLPYTSGTSFTGGVRVEGQVIIGGTGTGVVNVWVGSNVGTPDAVIHVDNAAWGTAGSDGVKQAALGLQHGSAGFQSANHTASTNVLFDEFDSRRQTAIGP